MKENDKTKFIAEIRQDIYDTRKCRIEAEKRVRRKEMFFSFINIYYSALVIIFSIVALTVASDSTELNIKLICVSIATFSITVFNSSKNYKELIFLYRSNYLELESLYRRTKTDIELAEINKKYEVILSRCPNHEDCDYYSYSKNRDKENCNFLMKLGRHRKYYLNVLVECAIRVLMIILPFILPIFLKFIKSFL